jgi:hypothetical protein
MRPRSLVTTASLVALIAAVPLATGHAQSDRVTAALVRSGPTAELHAGTSCLGDQHGAKISLTSAKPLAGQTVTFTAFAEPIGVVGFSTSVDGPFTDTLDVSFTLDGSGTGASELFYIRAIGTGTATVQACSALAGCVSDWFDVDVIGIDTVVLEAIDSPLDDNPNPAGGKRIYPDKTDPTDAVDRRTVRVKAITSDPRAGVPVYFATFDVDDPSSDARPVDANGAAGNDNRDEPRIGALSATTALTDASGIAETILTVTMQPGDNFRVAASCKANYLSGVTPVGTGLEDSTGRTLPTERADVADMLTVWRKLHVEVDSMGLVAGNQLAGTVRGADPRLVTSTTTINLDRPLERHRFSSGRLTVSGAGSFHVVDNDGNSVIVDAIVDATAVSGKAYVLVDDDDHNLDDGVLLLDGDEGENVRTPELTLITDGLDDGVCNNSALNPFGAAYVCPVFDVGDDNDFVPFVLNSPGTAAITSTYDFDAIASEQDPNFWTVYLLGAYQEDSALDLDPGKGKYLLGRADDIGGIGANVFQESIADAERTRGTFVLGCSNAVVVAHELGHLMNGTHPEGGLMGSPCDASLLYLSAKTIVTIRNLIHP